MSKNAYEILGVSPNADMKEIERQYLMLRDKYREEMYQEGALGKAAARKLNDIEQAYSDICAGRATAEVNHDKPSPIVMESAVNDIYTTVNDEHGASGANATSGAHSPAFDAVQAKLDENDIKGAQSVLDSVGKRDSEWHYFQAMIYYKKKWIKEAVDQMEMACQMEPSNTHYAKVLERLKAKAEESKTRTKTGYNEQTQGNADGYQRSYQERDARMAEDGVCRFCETLICVNCLCDCCCRG